MKVLTVHNYYRYPGGEDYVFEAEAALLESRGHQVLRYVQRNERIEHMATGLVAAGAIWNRTAYREIREVVRRERPDVVHFHNTFALISASGFPAARVNGTAVVQTLHNYRLLCPMAQLFREGGVCEDCVGRTVAWPGIVHGCYRDSRAATAVVSAMLAVGRGLGSRVQPDVYVALTEFARRKFVAGGLPADRIVVKPNFVAADPGRGTGEGDYALFVGRLAPEKGIDVLLEAWQRLEGRVPLVILGDGPLGPRVAEAAARGRGIEWLGWRSRDEVQARLRNARFLVFPSIWYETFGLSIVESFAAGRPVVASAIGALEELVEEGRTGWLFPPGDPAALAACVERAWSDPARSAELGRAARAEYEARYTAERAYQGLLSVYQAARDRVARREASVG